MHATESVTKQTVFPILLALAFPHLLNDTFQLLISAMYPLLKKSYDLNFAEVGIITITYPFVASILQLLVGWYTDRKPKVYVLTVAMNSTAIGLACFGLADSFVVLLAAVTLIGFGSSIFHLESSRVAHFASGGRKGMCLINISGRRQSRRFDVNHC